MIYLLIASVLSFVIVITHETYARSIFLKPLLTFIKEPLLVSVLYLFWETATVVFAIGGLAYLAASMGWVSADVAWVPSATFLVLAVVILFLALTSKSDKAMRTLAQWPILALISVLGIIGVMQ